MRIAYVVYPDFTALDLVGPYEVIGRWPGAEVHFLASASGPVRTDLGLTILPTDAPDTLTDPDLIVVPGSGNPLPVLSDHMLISWLRATAPKCQWTASVCTGAGLYAAAGLLEGKKTSTHWGFRDVVRAYVLLAERGRAGSVYNVCSGRAVSLDHCLRTLIGFAAQPLATELDPARLQANDVPAQVGNPTRLRRLTGWEPRIAVEQALADMLDYERGKGGDEGNRSGGRQGDEARPVHDRLSEAARTDR